jgi:hypothetical protein
MGNSSLPNDQKSPTTILGLEDGSNLLRETTQDCPPIGTFVKGALHHPLSATLALPTKVFLVGL